MAPPPGNFSLRIGRASLAGALSDQQRNGRMATQRNAAERDAAEAVHAPALPSSCPAVAAGFGRILIAALSAVLFLGVLAGQLRAQTGEAAPELRRILILYSADERLVATNIIGKALRERLDATSSPPTTVSSAFLDLGNYDDPAYVDSLAALLEVKHAAAPPDLVVALGPPALDFIVKYRDRVAPGARVAFALVGTRADRPGFAPGEIAGVYSEYNLPKTMELAAALQPGARDVYVVAGAAGFDQAWIDTARETLAGLSDRFDIHYIFDRPFADVVAELSQVAPDSIVLALSFFEDSDGRRFIPVEAARAFAAASPAPIYSPYDTFVGAGAVGAYGDTFETTGLALADLVLDMLSDAALPVEERVNTNVAFRVDARELERHGLSRDNLPAGTIVRFDEPTVWDRYWYVIVAVLAVIAVQSLLLMTMLAQRAYRRRAEAALRESEDRMAVAAESANIGLWHLDAATGELWLTQHGRSLLRLPAENALVPADLLASVHPEDRRLMACAISGLESGTPLSGEFRVDANDGVRWIQFIGDRGTGDADHHVSGIFKDITAQKTAQLEAEAQRRDIAHMSRALVLGELSGAIAHELNQPLTAILANAQAAQMLLHGDSPDIAEARSAIAEIIEDDSRAGEVIQRLRMLLRKDHEQWELIDINEIVDATLDLLRSELISRKIESRPSLAVPSGLVQGDPVQLQQVLLNLIVNAMDALGPPEPGHRLIAVRTLVAGDGHVEVVVEDSGPGFAPSQQGHLTEPFFTTKPDGLGLGLSICTRIVRMHGGTIAFSESTLGGARVTVTLPKAETRALAAE